MLSASLNFQVFFKLSLPYTSWDEGRIIYTSHTHTHKRGLSPCPLPLLPMVFPLGWESASSVPPCSPVGSCLLASVRAAVSLLIPRPSSTQHCTPHTHTHTHTQVYSEQWLYHAQAHDNTQFTLGRLFSNKSSHAQNHGSNICKTDIPINLHK